MSTPRFLTLPPGVRRTDIETSRGAFAALEAFPGSGISERGPALLIPGFTGSKEDFISVLQTLAGAGRRVITLDMRGQFETPGPDDASAYGCAELGADIAAVIESIGDPVHLVGHSFGGLVTRETVIGDPALVESFTLMSSGPAAITGGREVEGRVLLSALPKVGLEHLWSTRMEPEVLSKGVAPEIVAFLRRRMFMSSRSGLLGMANELLSCADRVDELAKATDGAGVPVLVLYGENDDAWEPQTQALMAERLGARKVVIPGAAHSPAVEAPETTASALTAFWNDAERT
ncbi:alpha/beta fold hydrolase [Actinoallomurus iriomotensis]|uniref:Alpha/beta hydrolase n=1 Tax=Actinoallomurus iriomotensis TaxID=478107 RepID=A0A9W6RYW2_9ACTN|nr:alpha/beta hydrolase [Actinoallomurus iriomotensis]GLY73186.1 alpha/beta hydrolase [Actinoallomurus iriomotensis]GLY84690.1 alpha/beta hydrolase [Actinoallomurus iriomotensis]